MAADAKTILRRWEDLKALRIGWEKTWTDIAFWMLPRRGPFQTRREPGRLRDRRVLDSTALINIERLSAMIFGFMVDPTMPFVRPTVDAAQVAAGMAVDLDEEGRDWLDGVTYAQHGHLMKPASGFSTALPEALLEYCAFGNGVVWTGAKQGFGARYQSRPLQSCWYAENEEGDIDTLYYAYTLPVWRVLQRWPEAAELKTIQATKERSDNATVKLLLAVEPREGGRFGAMAHAKPFVSAIVMVEEKVVLEEGGYDSFPYSVGRFYRVPGEVYGYGPGHMILNDVETLNAVMEVTLFGAEKRVDPPMMAPLRLFPKPVDRRMGAMNYYQASQLGLQTAEQAVRALYASGDVGLGFEIIRMLRGQVDYGTYTDWMRLRENGNMTATEVNDRRDMRLRGMTAIVGGAEKDLMGPLADRTFVVNADMGLYGEPPTSLQGLDLGWAYTGPLAMAQRQAQRDGISLTAALAAQVAQFDPTAARVFDGEEAIRAYADSIGQPPGVLRTRQAMAKLRELDEQQRQNAEASGDMQTQAAALRDGAQGVASLMNSGALQFQEAA